MALGLRCCASRAVEIRQTGGDKMMIRVGNLRSCVVGLGVVTYFLISEHIPAHADLVINWGGNYVNSKSSFDQNPNPDPSNGSDSYTDPLSGDLGSSRFYGRLPSDSDPYSPSLASMVNPPGPNPVFYGGHVVETTIPNGGGSAFKRGMSNLWMFGQNTNTDYMEVDVNPSNTLKKFAMMTYWKKDNFISDVNKTYKLNGSSVFTLKSTQDAGDKPDGHSLRWLIRNKSLVNNIEVEKFYVSTSAGFVKNNSTYTSANLSLFPNGLNSDYVWKEYTPATNGTAANLPSLLFDNSASFVQVASLSNITAVGFYVEFTPDPSKGADKVHYKVSGFDVTLDPDGNAVPEPGTFLLGLVGFGGVAARRWRQRRKAAAAKSATAAVS